MPNQRPIRTAAEIAESNAEQLALLRAVVPLLERGHRRGQHVDRSRTDGRELRGVPCVAPGVGGTMPGTDPLRAVLAGDKQRRRREQEAAGSVKRSRRRHHKRPDPQV